MIMMASTGRCVCARGRLLLRCGGDAAVGPWRQGGREAADRGDSPHHHHQHSTPTLSPLHPGNVDSGLQLSPNN